MGSSGGVGRRMLPCRPGVNVRPVLLDPATVPCTFVSLPEQLADLEGALRGAVRVAIDTETPISGPSARQLRVMSVATRSSQGVERAFVVDARDVAPHLLAPVLEGVTAAAWNADFDARVLDTAVWQQHRAAHGISWWDAQLADALLHQGLSGFTWYHGLAWATEHYLGLVAEGKGTVQLSYDAASNLTPEQISYSAADAVETLWVADRIEARIAEAGLAEICAVEMAARPFLDDMERVGLPFDWDGWQAELDSLRISHRQVLGHLAELTGGGQGTLFDDVVEPSWNPASDQQVRQVLNRHSTQEVHRWTTVERGGARDLDDRDSVRAGVLREIGGPICDALLDYRAGAKILTTYGDSIHDHLGEDGRLHPQYLQVVGTNTGRLASRNPNAQNFAPQMKPHIRPPDADRVFVYADLSQAELRYLAQVSGDEALRDAFAAGVDVHQTTAASMFRVDLETLRESDPERLKTLRQIAKALNFGIAYGQGANALARSLTANGTPTSPEEGRQLLADYLRTYPGIAAWADARDAEVRSWREVVGDIDWDLSLRLATGFGPVSSIRREFRSVHPRWPSAAEIAERLEAASISIGQSGSTVDEVIWLLGYSAPVALLTDGTPFTLASTTRAGRRQQFNLHLDRLFLLTIGVIDSSSDAAIQAGAATVGGKLGVGLQSGAAAVVERQLEDRILRRRVIAALADELGPAVLRGFLTAAAKERVGAMTNAWRNAGIQGGVADVMLLAYGDLHQRLRAFPSAAPVQTVHDSVVIECDRVDAEAVAAEVGAALDAASLRYCPDVAPRADVDIRESLADSDVIVSDIAVRQAVSDATALLRPL